MAKYDLKLQPIEQFKPSLQVLVHAANAYLAACAAERRNPGYRAYVVAVWVDGVRVETAPFRPSQP